MSDLLVNAGAAPNTPVAGKVSFFVDSADKRAKQKDEFGVVSALVGGGVDRNLLINSGFYLAQRQAPGTLTTYSNTTGRTFGADRWGMTNENASIQYQQVDSIAAPETGLLSRFYGKFKKLTSAGKMVISQVIEGIEGAVVRGRTVRVQLKMKSSVAMTVRVGVLQLNSAGTVDTMPATFVSAFGAAATDPTWGTNLAQIAPTTAQNATISASGLTCLVTTAWQQFSGTFDIPSTTRNIMLVIWTHNQPAANDELNLTEAGIFDGAELLDWTPRLLSDEVTMSQRYYAKTFGVNVAPVQNAGVATGCLRGILGKAGAVALAAQGQWRFPVPMRVAPTTITFYNPAAANVQVRQIGGTAADLTATASANPTDTSVDFTATGVAAGTVGDQFGLHISVDSEI